MAGTQAVAAAVTESDPEPTASAAADADDGPHETHPLQFHWSLWHDQPSRSKGWGVSLKQIATFKTVEEFWAYGSRAPARAFPLLPSRPRVWRG
jgi:hypothetical protein